MGGWIWVGKKRGAFEVGGLTFTYYRSDLCLMVQGQQSKIPIEVKIVTCDRVGGIFFLLSSYGENNNMNTLSKHTIFWEIMLYSLEWVQTTEDDAGRDGRKRIEWWRTTISSKRLKDFKNSTYWQQLFVISTEWRNGIFLSVPRFETGKVDDYEWVSCR